MSELSPPVAPDESACGASTGASGGAGAAAAAAGCDDCARAFKAPSDRSSINAAVHGNSQGRQRPTRERCFMDSPFASKEQEINEAERSASENQAALHP